MKLRIIGLHFICLFCGIEAFALERTHVVREGQTLSSILHAYEVKPIYGRNNYLEKTIRLNNLQDPDVLVPEQTLRLPFSAVVTQSLVQRQDESQPAVTKMNPTPLETKRGWNLEFTAESIDLGTRTQESGDISVLSSASGGVNFALHTLTTENWIARFQTSVNFTDWEVPRQTSLGAEDRLFFHLSQQLSRRIGALSIGAGLGLEERPVLSLRGSQVDVEARPLSVASLETSLAVLELKDIGVDVSARVTRYGDFGAGQTDLSPGYGFRGSVRISGFRILNQNIFTRSWFHRSVLGTQELSIEDTRVGMDIGLEVFE